MGHNYYWQDWEQGNERRLRYFDEWFKVLASDMAKAKGMSLSEYLGQIKNFETFKAILTEVFSQDASLANYVEGMSERDFRLFYKRPMIQEIVEANRERDYERIKEEIIPVAPVDVEQREGEIRVFFRAVYREKKTGKIRRTVGYEDEFIWRGRKRKVLRDSRGRFVKRT